MGSRASRNLRDTHMFETLNAQPRLERAIGVIYRPDTEIASQTSTLVIPTRLTRRRYDLAVV
jgi:erythromycin esterase-like protein